MQQQLNVIHVGIDPREELSASVRVGNVHVAEDRFKRRRILVGGRIPSIVVATRSGVAAAVEYLLLFRRQGKVVL